MLKRCADDLFSIATDSPADAQALAMALRESGAWLEVVPGIASVVVRFNNALQDASTVEGAIEDILAEGIAPLQIDGELIEIPVVYGDQFGPDFDAVCAAAGLSADELITLHTGSEYTVDMTGFTPGFAFIGGLDERLRMPRRSEPRQRVEPGSIGVADGRTGLYAMASPGGWHLIGRTPDTFFDPEATEPFRLRAGMRVRFKAVAADEFET